MDVSPIISSSIVRTGLFGTTSVQPVTFLLNPPATIAASSVDIVDISGLGQLLSASLIFEAGILKAAETNQAGFSTVVAATQFFVDAFNSFLQSDSLQSSSGGSISNLFIQMLNTQTAADSDDGESIIASLSGFGINFQAPTSQNLTGLMTIDLEALQSAFNADQLGTVSLLARATQSIGQLATEFTSLFAQVSILTQNPQSSPDAATLNGLLAAATTTETAAVAGTAAATEAAAVAEAATAGTAATARAAVAVETAATTETAEGGTAATARAAAAAGTAAATETAAAARAIAATETTLAMEATATGTTAEANAAATTPPATATLSAIESPDTTELTATPITTGLPVTTTLPATPVAVAATPTTVAPAATPQNLVSPTIDASNPAVAAAIAAYHVIDGIFDSSKPRVETNPESFPGYSEIRPVAPTQPVKLDLYA